MRMEAIMTKLKEIFDEFGDYPKNINCDNQFNNKEFIDYMTSKGKNSLIERFWRTLAGILQRARKGTKNFDWVKNLKDIVDNYNSQWHRTLKATPKQVLAGKKENPVQPKFVEATLEVGDKVRIRRERSIFDKGDVVTWSEEIYKIIGKTDHMFRIKNLNTGEVKRTYHSEELSQTFTKPPPKKQVVKKVVEKPKLNLKEVIAKRKVARMVKKPVWLENYNT
jgi:hypothetical protein